MRIGIDLGGTKIEGIILAPDYSVLTRHRIATPASDYKETVEAVCSVVNRLQTEADMRLSVGIGTPGALSAETGTMKNCNSICLNGKPLKSDIEAQLGYAVRLENDANCFTLSEVLQGAGRPYRSVFGVILGTGTGGGIVIDKTLVTGANGIGGEWGHNPIPAPARKLIGDDRACYCGRVNCVETILSGRGLQQTHLEQHGASLPANEIAGHARAGDAAALATIESYCAQLAICLATVINILDPEAIVLGGGLSNIELIYEMTPTHLGPHVFSDSVLTRLLPPSFGDASGARGAACLWL
ncbi:unnamed protein product [Discosporangium mesarthrocarpum]